MKELLSYILIVVIIFMSMTACSPYADSPINTNAAADIAIEKTEINNQTKSDDIQDWKKAYILFLCEFVISEDYEICQYALRDINSDGVPELIILQTDMSVNALLEIYSFKDGVFKTGEYTDAKVGSAFRISDNPLYPGLFDLRWGGGVEHYGYITVDGDLLVYEYLWFNNLAPEEVAQENGHPGKNMVSDNTELIELSENVFSNVTDNNILEMFILDNHNFQPITDYMN